ncbi:MAG TPA: uroporphyrinogen decarboxylase family protein [Phycisphaerae bacterium]|nr:uroporphyrinogen decarboxylase family protein [Phycisphaerae bacterium]
MNSRERVLAALRAEPTDRLPVYLDLGPFREQFRQMGIEDPEAHFGVDLRKIWFAPWAEQTRREPDAPRIGNEQQAANYRMWGYYPQRIDRRNPLIRAACADDIEAYHFPVVEAQGDISRLREAVASAHERSLAVAGQIPHLGGVVFETAYRLRGLDNLLEDLRLRPALASLLLERITDAACANVALLATCGVDIVVLGDDIGTPTSMLISPQMWREWLKPRLARIIDAARRVNPQVAVAYHSDGFYMPVIGDLIEIGVDILNPVQPDCMDPAAVRDRFGDAVTLWGTVGSATLLPFGEPEAVEREVRLRMETLGGRGRLILGPAYDLEDNVPVRNVLAFFEACGSTGA